MVTMSAGCVCGEGGGGGGVGSGFRCRSRGNHDDVSDELVMTLVTRPRRQ